MLRAKLAEIRSLIEDGNLPRIRFLLCNNGRPWSERAQLILDNEDIPDSVSFEHANHDTVVGLLQSTQPIKDRFSCRFCG